jgi:hypothetical protein
MSDQETTSKTAEKLRNQISQALENAYITFKVDDEGDHYITEGISFPFWIEVPNEGQFLRISTYISLVTGKENSGSKELEILRFINRLNQDGPPLLYFADDNKIRAVYWYYVRGKFDNKSLVLILRSIADAFKNAIVSLDEDDLIDKSS